MQASDIAQMIDHSLLKPELTLSDVEAGCQTAMKYGTATVCVRPCDVQAAAEFLAGSSVLVSTVVGFPHGSNLTAVKVFEAEQAMAQGAKELDMVLNIGRLRAGDFNFVQQDIQAVVQAAHAQDVVVKVIFENCFLDKKQIVKACQLAEAAGADFVKTSTGFGSGGATLADLRLMRDSCSPTMRLKAAGGVRTLEAALAVRAVGAVRFGATATEAIMDEALFLEEAARLTEIPDRESNTL